MIPPAAPFNALLSYAYYDKLEVSQLASWHALGLRFIGDSGAFSALTLGKRITTGNYGDWLTRLGPHLDWAASLDVIGNPAGTWANFVELRAAGHPVVPTVHVGADVKVLDRYVDRGCDLVGLGGMARRRDHPAVLRWLVKMFRYARDNHPGVRFHAWGVTRRDYLMHLPFWSADSSVFGQAYRYGRLTLVDPRSGLQKDYKLDGLGSHARSGELLRSWGVNPQDVKISHAGNRSLLVGLGAHASQALEGYYTRRHRVTPPASLPQLTEGTRIHFVDAAPAHTQMLADLMQGRPHLVKPLPANYVRPAPRRVRSASPSRPTKRTQP